MYDLILFDFDFTLVDSSKGIVASMHYAIEKLNQVIPSDKKILSTIGLSLRDAFFKLVATANNEQYNLFKQYFMESSKQVMVKSTVIFKDTVDTLRCLKEKGKKIAIVSAKDKETISKIAEQYDFLQFIDVIIGEHEVINQKPHPDQVCSALEVLNISAKNALYVGDSIVDGLAANNAFVDFLPITTGVTQRQEFCDIPRVGIASSLREALIFIE